MEYTPVDLLSLISSAVSIALAIIAICLSLYFFVQSRNVQQNVSSALVEIKTQTGLLQKLTFKQLDRLTKFVTERPDQQQLDELSKFSSIFREDLKRQEGIHKQLVKETLNCYIGIYFYTALTNYWAQGYIPSSDQFDKNNRDHVLARRVVDLSCEDFNLLAGILNNATPDELNASPLVGLMKETQERWRPFVRTSQQVFESRSV